MAFHQGQLYQRGYGLGGIFSSFIRRIIPAGRAFFRSKTGQALTDIGTEAATNALGDLVAGKSVKETAQENLNDAKRKIGSLIKRKIERLEESETESDEDRPTPPKKKLFKRKHKTVGKKRYNLLE